jgi:hypothetical protein
MTGFSVKALSVAVLAATLGTAMIGCSHKETPAPSAPVQAAAPQTQSFEDDKAKGMAADMAKMHAAQTQQH